MRNKPRIRFKGFTEDWEQRKLGDIATITGGGTPSTNISEYWNGDIDWYSPVEIGEKRYASGSIRKITKLGLEKSSAKILPVGTVLFTSRAGIGNTAILQVEGCTNQGFQSITPNSKELDTYFLYTMTPKLKRYGEVTGAGSTFVEVSGKQMEQMNLMIPSLDEQKHVSQLFKVMDDAITLHQRKLEKLKLAKKALLQKLFPKNGSQFPEIRFKGFTDAWEQRKLGSIGSTYTGLSGKTKEDFGHGEAKYITYLNVFQNTISNITMTDKVEIDPTQNEVKYGDVLFTTSSETPEEVGMSSVWLGDTPNIYLNSFCFGFRPNQKIDSYFLGYSLRAPYMRDRIKILAQGISRYNISKNKVMELEISLPNNEEQKLLGTFLQRIDLIITLHQCKLDKLQDVKKGLLQKMFV